MEEQEINYPTWRYHATLPACVANSAEEDALLGEGWADTPAAFLPAAEEAPAEEAPAESSEPKKKTSKKKE